MVRVILMGAPGAGKGTQADAIEHEYGYIKISTGDLIRAEISAKTIVGLEAKAVIGRGELLTDETIVQMLKKRLSQSDVRNGYIMDGFPRTRPQAEELTRMGVDREVVIYLEVVNNEVVVERLLSRLTCSNPRCGAIFNMAKSPSKRACLCDVCGEVLTQRADDNEETIRNRIRIYKKQTQPLIDYYQAKGAFHKIDASRSVESIFSDVKGVLN